MAAASAADDACGDDTGGNASRGERHAHPETMALLYSLLVQERPRATGF